MRVRMVVLVRVLCRRVQLLNITVLPSKSGSSSLVVLLKVLQDEQVQVTFLHVLVVFY